MSSIVDSLYTSINNGREGKNMGRSTGLPKLDGWIGGIQPSTYYLIFGNSGSGKSAITLYSFIYRPIKDKPDDKYTVIYFSLEMAPELLLAKLLGLYLWEEFGLVISYKNLMSWTDKLSDYAYECVQKSKDWLENVVMKHLIIYDKKLDRDSFYHIMCNNLEKLGTTTKSEDGRRMIYTPNDPNHILVCVIDHIGLCQSLPGATKKEEIDAISAYAVTLRERCKATFVILQQENRNSASMDRRKADMTECSSEDLKDSGSTFNDTQVCIGVYFPLKHKLKTCHDYPIIVDNDPTGFQGLRDRYRGLCLIKNRNGESDRYDNVNFFGEIGMWKELPKAEDIQDFSTYTSLKKKVEKKEDVPPRQAGPLTFKF